MGDNGSLVARNTTGRRIYRTDEPGEFVASQNGIWVEGTYGSIETALTIRLDQAERGQHYA